MENRRKNQRAKIAIAAEVDSDGDTLMGETRDLSAGGVSVILDRGLGEGLTIELALILTEDGIEHADEAPFETRADVIWAAPTDAGQTMLGLRFKEVAAEQARHLQRFLHALAQRAQHE